jgi:heme exporter protein B
MKEFFASIKSLIYKDLIIEWRMKYAINGILLHAVSAVFLVFLSVKVINAPTWNALFWIILLFSSVSAVAKGFTGETRERLLYYYTAVSPQSFLVAKMIFNILFMLLIALLCFGVYIILLGNTAAFTGWYIATMLLASVGFAALFTLISAIAAKSGNGSLLMPVLSFPVILPLLLVAIKASKKAVDGIDVSLLWPDLGVILALNTMIIALAYVLFPYLWRD